MADPTQMTWEQFERFVEAELRRSGVGLQEFGVEHHEVIEAHDGSYVIDNTARFEALGADFLVLVECKHHSNPIKREHVQVLNQKRQSTGAHKAMMFSTSKYQSGALHFAKEHRIALAWVVDGEATFETKSRFGVVRPPPGLPDYAAKVVASTDRSTVRHSLISPNRPEFILDELGVFEDHDR